MDKMKGWMFSFLVMICSLQLLSCNTIDLYEKVVPIPKHQWQSNFKPTFTFRIQDTTVPYQLYLVVRHKNQYRYNNVWVKLQAKGPAGATYAANLELPLANKEGWLGSGMDDVFEHRVPFTPDPEKFRFARAGEYAFTVEQIMREDPLQHIMNVGLRIEKQPAP